MLSLTRCAIVAVVCSTTLVPLQAQDRGAAKEGRSYLAKGETREGWYFGTGNEVIIEGTVLGDVYAAGGTVRIDGRVVGDVLVAGGLVIISGEVTDDIRAAGGSVLITGTVGKNISCAGGSVHLGNSADVRGGVHLAGGDVSIAGSVAGSAIVTSRALALTGTVGRNLTYRGETIEVAPGSRIWGDLDAVVADTTTVALDGSAVAGTISVRPQAKHEDAGDHTVSIWFRVLWIGSLLLTALLWVLLLPQSLDATASCIKQRPGTVLLWGIGGIVALPIAILICLVTLLGIPLGIALGALSLILLYLSAVVAGTALGVALRRGEGRQGLLIAAFFGIIILQLLILVPVVKILVILVIIVGGLGAILSTTYQALRDSRA